MSRGSAEDGRRGAMVLRVVAVLGAGAAAMAFATRAEAQGYAGRWTASTMRESVSVESWGPDCGRRPTPTVSPGGAVTISMSGDHLSIRGAHSWRTNACWVRSSAMQRRSTSASGTSWSTSCSSGPNVAQPERGTFTLRAATPDRLEFRARWENDWRVAESHCHAIFRGSRVYTRASTAASPEAPEAPGPSERPRAPTPGERPETTPRGPACEPGAPARVLVRPRDLVLAPGERRCFQARVVDAAGCTVPRAPLAWSTVGSARAGGSMSDDGCFSADGAEVAGQGSFAVQVSSGELRAEATVRVRSTDLADITATSLGSEGGGAEEGLDEPGAGGESRGVRASVDDEADDDRIALYAGLVAMSALALVLAGVAVVLWRRQPERRPAPRKSRVPGSPSVVPPVRASVVPPDGTSRPSAMPAPAVSAPPPQPAPSSPTQASSGAGPGLRAGPTEQPAPPGPAAAAMAVPPPPPPPSRPSARVTPKASPAVHVSSDEPMVCPACQQEFETGAAFCPMDGSKLVSAETASARPGNVCPACHRGFDASVKVCPHDAEELVPQPLYEATRRGSSPSIEAGEASAVERAGKICPTCASRYDVDATFCGRDGSALVLVN